MRVLRDIRTTWPRSPRARYGSRGSSPEDRYVPEIRCCRPLTIDPDRRCGTSALRLLPRTDRREISPSSAPDALGIHAPHLLHRCTAPPLRRSAQAENIYLKHTCVDF